MKNSLVSVIIPTFNRFECLFKAIESAINQTYPNIEIIVIDDNFENPELRKRINKVITLKYPKVRYLMPDAHLGGSFARNEGIKVATGEYIAFLDDDDEFLPSKVEEQLKVFKTARTERLAMVYCYGNVIYPNGTTEIENTDIVGCPIDTQMYFNIAGTSFWLIRRDVLVEIGGFDKIYCHQDGIVILKLLAKTYTLDIVRKPLVNYYAHNHDAGVTTVSMQSINADKEYFEICKKYFPVLTKKQQKTVMYNTYRSIVLDEYRINEKKLAKQDYKQALQTNMGIKNKLKLACFWICKQVVLHNTLKKDQKYMENTNG